MPNYTKHEAIRKIVVCAKKYQKELNGNTLLFVCKGKHHDISFFEFTFRPENFMHLTGVKVVRSRDAENNQRKDSVNIVGAKDFFEKCLNQRLSPDDFELAGDGTTEMKLDVLPNILNKTLSAKMIGDYTSVKPHLYTERLAGGVRACMGFVIHENSRQYVPNTVLKEDIRNNVSNYSQVIAAFRKKTGADIYEELTYKSKGIVWEEIDFPEPYQNLLSLIMRENRG